jgi:hypothetical protein
VDIEWVVQEDGWLVGGRGGVECYVEEGFDCGDRCVELFVRDNVCCQVACHVMAHVN